MPPLLRKAAARTLGLIRAVPFLHAPIHAAAVRLGQTRWGAEFIKSVLEPGHLSAAEYRRWITEHEALSPSERYAASAHLDRMSHRPLISVVMPAYATPEPFLRAAVESVRAQLYPNWELCIADDASPGEDLWRALADYAERDGCIKVIRRKENGHICAATNSALALASGEFVALMDHDDLLAEHALYEVAAAIERRPDADLIYSDEDKIDGRGRRFEPHFKTGWNAELMLGQNMVSHLAVFRRELLIKVGGLQVGFEGAQDLDLVLRASAQTSPERIVHIPQVLYHWRQQAGVESFSECQMERCAAAARRAVEEHLKRTGQEAAQVENLPATPGWLQVRRGLPSPAPLVSVIVPTRDRPDLLSRCAQGLLQATSYGPLELLIVDNGSTLAATQALFETLRADARVRILPAPGPFNFSALNNQAAGVARGEILVLLNDDISVRDPDWLGQMVGQAVRPNVGAVGAKLLYPGGRVQHGGVVVGMGPRPTVAGHEGLGMAADDPGYHGRLAMARYVSAVTGACLALRREVFEEVGGLDERGLSVAFNDVDLCLKIRAHGYDIVWTPLATLNHEESASRGSDKTSAAKPRFLAQVGVMRARWGDVLDADPFANPNLVPGSHRLAWPPRRRPSWEPPSRTMKP